MNTVSEIDVMKTIEVEIAKISDPDTRVRILRWAWDKYADATAKMDPEGLGSGKAKSKKKSTKSIAGAVTSKAKAGPLSIVKDLNLKPQGKDTFADFIKKKNPLSQHEQCLCAIYYLRNVAGVSTVSANHVYTCFKLAGWRVPANIKNVMQVAASTKGWLDTSNASDIRMTIHGDNYVEHDLPGKPSAKGK